ncbi:phosphoglucosamine mutase [Thermodesulfitimonas autotrophica]|uniref:Phosphoglucosamine mutase n=1 Tax=Thermodesulfitimonas autotrophica TaxID=1894989 RepID=A0A3N5B087_9THEO|nr:phosphoglucosamine mutase [Thermodesulfitimonas autotrophica]RPF42878.1 phosphoglucosamine mutase [Thermodesulfitimonas autotrophica]
MGLLFGTDGVRGVANRELSPDLAFKLGRAGAYVLARRAGKGIVVGRDTRLSGEMLEAAVVAGILSAGVNALLLGVLPTPAVAYLTRTLGAAGGVVISASHNPAPDNGIKFFGADGYKLPDPVEEEIEGLVLGDMAAVPSPVGAGIGRVVPVKDAADRYMAHVLTVGPRTLEGLRVAVDCAHGAAYEIAPRLLRVLGAEIIPVGVEPDGLNINSGCGATKPHVLQELVFATGADLGLAFDGDADRLIAVDEKGNIVDGDAIILAAARYLKAKEKLPGNTVVVTVMSNLGLHRTLASSGINVVVTKVGDRYVLEEMLRVGAALGGEQSGHVIFLDHNTTGDGIITALMLLKIMQESGKTLGALAAELRRYPQLLKNVRVRDKELVLKSPLLARAVREQEARLAGDGRILVRASGTEPVIRIMVEARDPDTTLRMVDELAAVVRAIEGGEAEERQEAGVQI